jgi:hypothetical protein
MPSSMVYLTSTARNPGKYLAKIGERRAIDPYARQEVAVMLHAAKQKEPALYHLPCCAVRAGLRQGGLIVLEWGGLHFAGRFIHVQRSYTRDQPVYAEQQMGQAQPSRTLLGTGTG